jgi:hypothetical protein
MSGYVVVDNATGHAVHAAGCGDLFQVVLTSTTYRPQVAWLACLQSFTIPAGTSRYPVEVLAVYNACSRAPQHGGLRPCLPDGQAPPLPPGTYRAKLFQSGKLVQAPPPLTVRVTPLPT